MDPQTVAITLYAPRDLGGGRLSLRVFVEVLDHRADRSTLQGKPRNRLIMEHLSYTFAWDGERWNAHEYSPELSVQHG